MKSIRTFAENYLAERRHYGFDLKQIGAIVNHFARFVSNKHHKGPITSSIVKRWIMEYEGSNRPITRARRLQAVLPFLRYLKQYDPLTEVPDRYTFGSPFRRLTPHIYTDHEISELLRSAHNLSPNDAFRSATFETMLGLIAVAGLRVSEARNLLCSDVDLKQGSLTIRNTKFGKSRLVPIHRTVTKKLASYAKVRSSIALLDDKSYFFMDRPSFADE
jgi:integrase/recombinase XerC